jgi:predicted phosphodiesterase
MSFQWLPEEEHLLRLLRGKHNYQEIAEEFLKRTKANVPGFKWERTAEAIKMKCKRDNLTPETCDKYTSSNNPYTARFAAMKDIQKKYESLSVERNRGLIPEDQIVRKILTLSDIHFPFARNDLLEKVIAEHEDSDIVVINGDMFEGYAHSRFEKGKRISALAEYQLAFAFVTMLSERFSEVYLVDGNHDIRVASYLKKQGLEIEESQILRPNLIARIANGEKLDDTGMLIDKLKFNNVFYEQRESWYIRIGKTLFVHPWNRGGSPPGFTAKKVNDVFRLRYDENEYDSIVVGHTHKIYKGVVDSRLLIEQGCMAGLLGYAHSPRMEFTVNGQNGYAVIYQDTHGNTDFNWSGPVFLGELLPPKKSILG